MDGESVSVAERARESAWVSAPEWVRVLVARVRDNEDQSQRRGVAHRD